VQLARWTDKTQHVLPRGSPSGRQRQVVACESAPDAHICGPRCCGKMVCRTSTALHNRWPTALTRLSLYGGVGKVQVDAVNGRPLLHLALDAEASKACAVWPRHQLVEAADQHIQAQVRPVVADER
jgi:hypothetical protein